MSALAIACVVAGALLFEVALVLVLAASLAGRRPDDRRSAREFEAFQASLRHPASRARVEAQIARALVDRRRP